MNETHEVISAFLDDEPFDPRALANALAEPSGRALLIDLMALRHIVQPDEAGAAGTVGLLKPRHSAARAFMAAAAVFVALVGGYLVGQRWSEAALSQPPPPTRVVQGPSTWQTPAPITGAIRSAQ